MLKLLLRSDWSVSEHLRMCEERLAPLLSPSEKLSEDEVVRLGKKDPEQEVCLLGSSLFLFPQVPLLPTCPSVSSSPFTFPGGEVSVDQHSGAQ